MGTDIPGRGTAQACRRKRTTQHQGSFGAPLRGGFLGLCFLSNLSPGLSPRVRRDQVRLRRKRPGPAPRPRLDPQLGRETGSPRSAAKPIPFPSGWNPKARSSLSRTFLPRAFEGQVHAGMVSARSSSLSSRLPGKLFGPVLARYLARVDPNARSRSPA